MEGFRRTISTTSMLGNSTDWPARSRHPRAPLREFTRFLKKDLEIDRAAKNSNSDWMDIGVRRVSYHVSFLTLAVLTLFSCIFPELVVFHISIPPTFLYP